MNWRYFVGRSIANLGNSIISSKAMPLMREIPVGISYPYDVKRFYKNYRVSKIFDVGANIGQTSLFLNNHFPQATILAFEPVKSTYDVLCQRTQNLRNIQGFNLALGSQDAQKLILTRGNSELNSLVGAIEKLEKEENQELETVTITTIDRFCHDHDIQKIDLLKMDVQGYEMEILYGSEKYIRNNLISFIYSEVDFEESNPECQNFEEINAFLNHHGFRLSGFYEPFRWGENKQYLGFCNALFVNCNL